MDVLIVSQIVFNITATLVLLIVGLMIGIVGYCAITLILDLKKALRSANQASQEMYHRFENLWGSLNIMSFISRFLHKDKKSKKKEV